MIKVSIINIPSQYYNYCQWLLLGFKHLSDENKINLVYRQSYFHRILSGLYRKVLKKDSRDYCFIFKLSYRDKEVKLVYDFSDTPFLFDIERLLSCDLYFKAQYPKNLSTGKFIIPSVFEYKYPESVMSNFNKIKPSLIGIRALGASLNLEKIDSFYNNLLLNRKYEERNGSFVYFGSSNFDQKVYSNCYHDEGYFWRKLSSSKSHPNFFRQYLALNNQGNDSYTYLGDSDIGNPIDFKYYFSKLSTYRTNINVSGLRNSMPNRFMDSFLTGCSVATDNLYVKWYVDISDLVFEYGDVSYINLNVKEKQDILDKIKAYEPKLSPAEIYKFYDDYLSPKAFAEYVVSTAISQIESEVS